MALSFDELAALLGAYADGIDQVWVEYQARGPGEVDPALFDPIEQLACSLDALRDCPLPADMDRGVVTAAIRQATDLAGRCAKLPQGLCFVSGEAGLVPRRDQIDAFATARAVVRVAYERLCGA